MLGDIIWYFSCSSLLFFFHEVIYLLNYYFVYFLFSLFLFINFLVLSVHHASKFIINSFLRVVVTVHVQYFNHILVMDACLTASSFKEILENKLQETQHKCIHFCFIYFRDNLLDLLITLFFHNRVKSCIANMACKHWKFHANQTLSSIMLNLQSFLRIL